MDATRDSVYYIIPEGATQEEACSWEDLEADCRSGRLSPDTLIYLPEKDAWEKAIFTELRKFFRRVDEREEPEGSGDVDDGEEAAAALQEAYEEARGEAQRNLDSSQAHLNAARAALAVRERAAAVEHCRRAIELQPFNEKIAAEIKRIIGPLEAGKLPLLKRPAPFWDDLYRLTAFPLRRGAALFFIPASMIMVLALIPLLRPAAAALSFLWATATVLQVASGNRGPFDFRRMLSAEARRMIKPILIGASVIGELYLPFVLFAELLVLTGVSDRANAIQLIRNSEVMIVFMWVAGVVYLPAAFAITAGPGAGWKQSMNVRNVYHAVMAMEMEYLAAVVLLFIPVTVWGAGRLFLESVPVAGIVLPAAVGLYGLIIAGFVVGLLSARHRHQWMRDAAVRRESRPVEVQ